jgi:ubiquinone/menaquinone biosynthesis C-methylase UbiE
MRKNKEMSNIYEYSGDELNVFENAINWKAYWKLNLQQYLGNKVLEVGAGIGANTITLKDLPFERWLCVEPDINLAKKIIEKKQLGLLSEKHEIKSCFISELSNEKFDTILYVDVLEHIENDEEEIKNAFNLLSPNGKIIVISPAHNYLYTSFDQKIGHFRRYNKKMLRNLVVPSTKLKELKYLDSIGLFASLANKMILKTSEPKLNQIKFWDSYMIPLSKVIDPLIGFNMGKSIYAVFEKNQSIID